MGEPDHEQIADRLQDESDALERHARELEDEIEHTRSDWERKRADAAVPGAPPPDNGGQENGGQEPEAEFPAKEESKESDERG